MQAKRTRMVGGRMNWPAAIMLVCFVGFAVYQSHATRPVVVAKPSAVATVNLEMLFKNLVERSAVDARLVAMAEELDGNGLEMRAELDALVQDLELFSPGSRQYEDTSKQIAERGYRLQAYREFAVRKLEVEKAAALRDLYARIKDAVRDLADQEGYDLVLVDDAVVPLPTDATESDTWVQISARRTLHANPQIEVTDTLLRLMNDRYNQDNGG